MCLWQDIWSCLGPSLILQSQSQADQAPVILLSKGRGQSHHHVHPWEAVSKYLTGKWDKEKTGREQENLRSNTPAPRAHTQASLALD